MYKQILIPQYKEFHDRYRTLNKKCPFLSKNEKTKQVLTAMASLRKNNASNFIQFLQYSSEVEAICIDVLGFMTHYFADKDLIEWLTDMEVKDSDYVKELFNQEADMNGQVSVKESYPSLYVALHTKDMGYVFGFVKTENHLFVNILTETMNYSAAVGELEHHVGYEKEEQMYRLAVNFYFYIHAFPDCVLDGVPPSEKKIAKAKSVQISPKVIERTVKGSDGRTIKPFLRRGFFRHYRSDYYVNKKGTVGFIAATMVGCKAKTVIKE